MAGREYRMRKRAEGLDATRERIVEATAALHYEQGVGATSYVQIAERAGVGPATVYRHFPTLGSLVQACGAAVSDGDPAAAAGGRAGLVCRPRVPDRSVWNASSPSWTRSTTAAAVWLAIAARDRDRVPELDAFLRQVDAGLQALVREAIGAEVPEAAIRLATALADVSVWRSLKRLDAPPDEFRRTMVRLLTCAISVSRSEPDCLELPDG